MMSSVVPVAGIALQNTVARPGNSGDAAPHTYRYSRHLYGAVITGQWRANVAVSGETGSPSRLAPSMSVTHQEHLAANEHGSTVVVSAATANVAALRALDGTEHHQDERRGRQSGCLRQSPVVTSIPSRLATRFVWNSTTSPISRAPSRRRNISSARARQISTPDRSCIRAAMP